MKYIAYLQVIGIILVVFGHSFHEYPDGDYGRSLIVYRMMYSFRMPLFMFVSGFLMLFTMKQRGSRTRTWREFTANKLKRLMIPFVVVSAVAFVPRAIMSGMADEPIPFDFMYFLKSLVTNGNLVIPYYWFLQASFVLLVSVYALLVISDRFDVSRGVVLLVLTVAVGGLQFLPIRWPTFFSLNEVIRLGVYFAAGAAFSHYSEDIDRYLHWDSKRVFVSLMLVWGALFFLVEGTSWIVVCSFFGIAMCISFVRILERYDITVLDHLMGANYMIFLLSWFCNVATQQVLHHFVEMPWWVFTILSLVGGVYIPWLLYRLMCRYAGKRWMRPIAFLLGQSLRQRGATRVGNHVSNDSESK